MAKRSGIRRERRERRFVPQSTMDPKVVYGIGVVGSLLLGAGVWGQFGNLLRKQEIESLSAAPWILGGALVLGVAIWLGTSAADAVRVGAGASPSSAWSASRGGRSTRSPAAPPRSGTRQGRDRRVLSITFENRAVPGALAWVLKEARQRVPM